MIEIIRNSFFFISVNRLPTLAYSMSRHINLTFSSSLPFDRDEHINSSTRFLGPPQSTLKPLSNDLQCNEVRKIYGTSSLLLNVISGQFSIAEISTNQLQILAPHFHQKPRIACNRLSNDFMTGLFL